MRTLAFFRLAQLVALMALSQAALSQTIDLRTYFPAGLNYYRTAAGVQTHLHNFFYVPQSTSNSFGWVYLNYFNQNLPGSSLLIWQKQYEPCTSAYTYAFLVMGGGSDKRVKEVGDWYSGPGCTGAYRPLGYRTPSTPTGLNWSTSGGLDGSYSQHSWMYVFTNLSPYINTGILTYASPAVVQVMPTWQPKYGRDAQGNWVANPNKTYYNVARVRMYHGTTQSHNQCYGLDPNNPYSGTYYHTPQYSSYAFEFVMDQTHGILQETFLWSEEAMDGRSVCDSRYPALSSSANLPSALAMFEYYIDN